ncbi:penicillin-binding transpeptidase domain-containing protein [Gracilibacillus sp. YIM 98692]|uniref:penicillin-binding transpeptidase domain-containing protein n=1 Tax=Gracilibacillus sp. YIM 98692 TaxID=2663532 RepID=UPI0013D63C07|nr:penicillin-binding transpeptidase domain-containing protein [Gracilibacillus sp. YIM 98692]
MRKLLGVLTVVLITLIGCQDKEEEVTPEDRLQAYLELWSDRNFEEMYTMVKGASKEAFVDRYPKVYQDLEVENLQLDYVVPEMEETEEEATEKEEQAFLLQVKMETIAGTIDYETPLTMVKDVEEVDNQEVTDWLVQWDTHFILPSLEEDDTITINTFEPARGSIYDRNRQGLAVNENIYELGVVPERFSEENEQVEKESIASALGITVEEIDESLNQSWVQPHYFVPLKVVPGLSEDGLDEEVKTNNALTYRTVTGRIYPFEEAAAHLIGYIAPLTAEKLEEVDSDIYNENDMIGYRGLEELFEEELRGTEGVQIIVEKENKEDKVISEQKVQNGENITLAIDASVQKRLFESLEGDAGTAAAIDPKTGDTLALVSSPAFDPNAFLYGLSNSQWNDWQEDPQNPLLNRFTSTFAPGSAFKPITSVIGLESGEIDPNEGLEINGLTWQKEGWGNYRVRRVSESNGPVDLKDALVRSDNIYFAQQALQIGAETLTDGLKDFGFDEDFPFTYPISASEITSDQSLDNEVLLADTSYGQGEIEMSALHMATAYSSFLNDGTMMKPRLTMDEASAEAWKEGLVSNEHASFIQESLRAVVTEGTGQDANIANVSISGKTGTAELKQSQSDEGGQENGWFVGYPENQDMIIAMMIEHIEDKGNGSGYVAEKVANVLNDIR